MDRLLPLSLALPSSDITRRIAVSVGLSLLSAFYFAVIFRDLVQAYGEAAPYAIGDWEVNYASGFIRRGLPGELARRLYLLFGLDIKATILVLQVSAYVAFFSAAVPVISRLLARHPATAFLVFSPLTLSFKALDLGGGTAGSTGLKDVLFVALFALQTAFRLPLWAICVAWIGLVLSHEAFFFYLPFSCLIVIAKGQANARQLAWLSLPVIIVFALCVVFHGDPQARAVICHSLGADAPAHCEDAGAIAWIGRSAITLLKGTYYQSVQPPYILLNTLQVAMLGGLGLALALTDRALAQAVSRLPRGLLALCFVLPLAAFLPSDHGRMLALWFMGALFVLAAVAQSTPATERPSPGIPLARGLWVLLLVFYATGWSAQGPCCPDRIGNGFAGRAWLAIVARL